MLVKSVLQAASKLGKALVQKPQDQGQREELGLRPNPVVQSPLTTTAVNLSSLITACITARYNLCNRCSKQTTMLLHISQQGVALSLGLWHGI